MLLKSGYFQDNITTHFTASFMAVSTGYVMHASPAITRFSLLAIARHSAFYKLHKMSCAIVVYPGLETNARPRRVKFRPGEWFVRPDQPGGRVDILRGFITMNMYMIL